MIITWSYIVCAVLTVAIILGKFDPDRRPRKQIPFHKAVLVVSQLTYNADPDFFLRNARLAGVTLQVQRNTGGYTEEYADSGYAHVCTRKDLAGAR